MCMFFFGNLSSYLAQVIVCDMRFQGVDHATVIHPRKKCKYMYMNALKTSLGLMMLMCFFSSQLVTIMLNLLALLSIMYLVANAGIQTNQIPLGTVMLNKTQTCTSWHWSCIPMYLLKNYQVLIHWFLRKRINCGVIIQFRLGSFINVYNLWKCSD